MLHAAAALFKKAPQTRVTDKAKETFGSKPAVAYGRRPIPDATAREAAADARGMASLFSTSGGAASTSASGSAAATTSSDSIVEEVLYRRGAVVFIAGLRGRLYVAELTDSLTEFRYPDGTVRVSRQYLGCRYFVETNEIFAWPPAKVYWASHGITQAAEAERRATASDGAHYSFYGQPDTVAHSVILREANETFERCAYRSQLASFALTLEDLAEAREQLSGGADLPLDDAAIEASQPNAAASAAHAAAEAKTATQDAERNIRNKQRAAGKRRMGDD